MTDQLHPDELSAIAADDALLDAIASGDRPDSDLGDLLTSWRRELDAAAVTATGATGVVIPLRRPRWHRHLAGGVAAVVVLAASTGVAAAAGGSSGPLAPLHKLIFGEPAPHPDATVVEVVRILDGVRRSIDAHQGGIDGADRAALANHLDDADALIAADDHAPAGLGARSDRLRTALNALPTLSVPAPAGAGTTGQPGGEDSSGTGSPTSGHGDTAGSAGGTGDGSSNGSGDGSGNDGQSDGQDGSTGGSSGGSGDGTGRHHGGAADEATTGTTDSSQDGSGDGSGDTVTGGSDSGSQDGSGGGSSSDSTSGDSGDTSSTGSSSTGSSGDGSLDGGGSGDTSTQESGGSDGGSDATSLDAALTAD